MPISPTPSVHCKTPVTSDSISRRNSMQSIQNNPDIDLDSSARASSDNQSLESIKVLPTDKSIHTANQSKAEEIDKYQLLLEDLLFNIYAINSNIFTFSQELEVYINLKVNINHNKIKNFIDESYTDIISNNKNKTPDFNDISLNALFQNICEKFFSILDYSKIWHISYTPGDSDACLGHISKLPNKLEGYCEFPLHPNTNVAESEGGGTSQVEREIKTVEVHLESMQYYAPIDCKAYTTKGVKTFYSQYSGIHFGKISYVDQNGKNIPLKDKEYFSYSDVLGRIGFIKNHTNAFSDAEQTAFDANQNNILETCRAIEEVVKGYTTLISETREKLLSEQRSMTDLFIPMPLVFSTALFLLTTLLSSAPAAILIAPCLIAVLIVGAVITRKIMDAWKRHSDIPETLKAADHLEKNLYLIQEITLKINFVLRAINEVRQSQYLLEESKKPLTPIKKQSNALESAKLSLQALEIQFKGLTDMPSHHQQVSI